ncbi:MAG: tRNA (guanosine(46)-N7)-methyltransferase TrmB [Clostridia bacterium]|nr:tRNA (guanosine(46)-N7)-methyltransferase TrmB [Clostridia bacterium]
MRIRFKPWARPELEASSFYIDNPEDYKGKWNTLFKNDNPIHLELGCGKGSFISQLAVSNENINYIAVDLVDAMLGLAKRNVEATYAESNKEVDNIYLTRYDIERILNIFDKNDQIERIYINFCNPWPRGKHHKKRLTHTRQLEKYREFLKDGAEIYFKTDDDALFSDSLSYFEESGFEIIDKTFDLESTPDFWNNIMTEHEKMFMEQGIKIKALKAKKGKIMARE